MVSSATVSKHHNPNSHNTEVQLVVECCVCTGFSSFATVPVPSSVTTGYLYPILKALLMALLYPPRYERITVTPPNTSHGTMCKSGGVFVYI